MAPKSATNNCNNQLGNETMFKMSGDGRRNNPQMYVHLIYIWHMYQMWWRKPDSAMKSNDITLI